MNQHFGKAKSEDQPPYSKEDKCMVSVKVKNIVERYMLPKDTVFSILVVVILLTLYWPLSA